MYWETALISSLDKCLGCKYSAKKTDVLPRETSNKLHQSNCFAAGDKIMQHYETNLYNIKQHYVNRGDLWPHFRRLIAVNDRFCGDNLIGI